MYETTVTVVGNVATAVEYRQTTAGVSVARFRMATTERRWDKARERWVDGDTSFYTVRAWRSLADNLAASVAVGEPLVVHGRLRMREGERPEDRGGQRWVSAEVDAFTIGHDLSRGTAAFRRISRARPDLVPQPGTSAATAVAMVDAVGAAQAASSTEAATRAPAVTKAEATPEEGAAGPGPKAASMPLGAPAPPGRPGRRSPATTSAGRVLTLLSDSPEKVSVP
ncbi:single-stranded DNA-binding protein [Streptomyces sp. MST-110588]|uniref:single-stranded DNA-binding protein n=1 Tax=Streptomyces sp. MST-110588 TaxID=2833628 RepID=UPI001F5CCA96|nr:single-stranded DNA-binding protein [Streptomyces sp. MST-110588]UNO41963.1 single-stranded DNA-binding protein [Streptomyces sp. MST-110588]